MSPRRTTSAGARGERPRIATGAQEYSTRWGIRLRRLALLSALVLVTLFTMLVTRSTGRTVERVAQSLEGLASFPEMQQGGVAHQ